jgi:hypothetical protein
MIFSRQFRPNDVFIMGHPGSGQEWFRALVAGLVHGVPPDLATREELDALVPDVDATAGWERKAPVAYFVGRDVPRPEHQTVVVLLRDGRDVVAEEGPDASATTWKAHVEAWLEARTDTRHPRRILFIRYEDLVVSPAHELLRFCDFVGIERPLRVIEQVAEEAASLRAGHPGAFRNEMTPEALAELEREAGSTLRRCGYHLEAETIRARACA